MLAASKKRIRSAIGERIHGRGVRRAAILGSLALSALWVCARWPQWRQGYAIYRIERKIYQLRPGMGELEVAQILGEPDAVSRSVAPRGVAAVVDYPYVRLHFRSGRLIAIRVRPGYEARPPVYRRLWGRVRAFVLPVRTLPS